MKNKINKLTNFLGLILFGLEIACNKEPELAYFGKGKAPILSANVSNVAASASDSNNIVVRIFWTNPGYGNDSNTTKYILQFDSLGSNFSNPYYDTIIGKTYVDYTGSLLNKIFESLLYKLNKTYTMQVKVTSSYYNNNEPYTSSIYTFSVKPYGVAPKIQLPFMDSLFIVGDATKGGWNNPVPSPSQKFVKIDSVTYIGTFNLNGGKEYLLLPENGNWDYKYAVNSKLVPNLNKGGDFGYGLNDNFPGPDSSGYYKITVDFQYGKFKVEKM